MKTFFKKLTQVAVLATSLFSNVNAACVDADKIINLDFCRYEVLVYENDVSCLVTELNTKNETLQDFVGLMGGVFVCEKYTQFRKDDTCLCHLDFCACEAVPIEKRVQLILKQLNEVVRRFPDKSAKFVHTAFAEEKLLQTYLLIEMLLFLGYYNVKVNLIGPRIIPKYVECFETKIKEKHPETKFEIFSYLWAQDYVAAVNEGQASKGHSFDLVDIRINIDPAALHNPYVDFAFLGDAMEPSVVIFELGCGSGQDVKQYRDVAEYREQHSLHFPTQEKKYGD